MRSVDIVVLRAYGTAEDVGIYALAYQSYTMLQTLAVTVTIVLIPLFVSLREAGREELVARYFERLVPQGIFAASVLGGLLAPLVVLGVPLVFGDGVRATPGHRWRCSSRHSPCSAWRACSRRSSCSTSARARRRSINVAALAAQHRRRHRPRRGARHRRGSARRSRRSRRSR